MTALLTTDFVERLKIATCTFMPLFGQETSGQGSGRIIVRELHAPLWSANISTMQLDHDDALDVQSDILNLAGSQETFYAYDMRRLGPKADPTGTILGVSTPVVIDTVVDNQHLKLGGLPVGYTLDRDYLAFDYNSPAQRALHQMIGSATADGSGITGSFKVAPAMRSSPSVSAAVTLIKASCEMRIVPGSLQTSTAGLFTTYTFTAVQVI